MPIKPLTTRCSEAGTSVDVLRCEQQDKMCSKAFYYNMQTFLACAAGAAVFGIGYYFTDKKHPRVHEVRAMRHKKEYAVSMIRHWCNSPRSSNGHSTDNDDNASKHEFSSYDQQLHRLIEQAKEKQLSGAWSGHYTEGRTTKKGTSAYSLQFDQEGDEASSDTICFHGIGKDNDGEFVVEDGHYNFSTGRLAWGERSNSLYVSCQMECANEHCTSLKGEYVSITGLSGDLFMKLADNTFEDLPVSQHEWVSL